MTSGEYIIESDNFPIADVIFADERAACETEDPELFFPNPEAREVLRLRQEAAAKAVCGECAVRSACLGFALEQNIRDGVWGGMSESERGRLKTLENRREIYKQITEPSF